MGLKSDSELKFRIRGKISHVYQISGTFYQNHIFPFSDELTKKERQKIKAGFGFTYFTDIFLPLFDEVSDLVSAGRYFW